MACSSHPSVRSPITSILPKKRALAFLASPSISANKYRRHGKLCISEFEDELAVYLICIQGYLLVADTITLSVGFCVDARKGRDRVPTGISGYEKRVRQWNFPVCCYGV